jgi:hypothetical protein
VSSSNSEKVRTAVTWPAVVWIITIVLFRVAALAYPPAGTELLANIYPVATTLGLLLGVWTGFGVKNAKGSVQEAILAGVVVGLAFAVPGIIIFGLGFVGAAINITIFTLATAWTAWGLK